MAQELAVLDSQIFDLLLGLSETRLALIRKRYRLATTDVNVLELQRIPDHSKREKIADLIRSCEIIGAKIFGMPSYDDVVIEDSVGGFATMDSIGGGRFLRYEDADILKAIGAEKNKQSRGRSQNDAAIALAIIHSKGIGVTEDQTLRARLSKLGAVILSFDEFVGEAEKNL